MLKSMTAFGRASVECPVGQFIVEVKSLNRKYLDIAVSSQRELGRFEPDIRNWVAEKVFRGKVEVTIRASFEGEAPVSVKPNLPLARQLKKAWEAIAKELHIVETVELELLQSEPGIFLYDENLENEDSYRAAIHEAVNLALDAALQMKRREGEALQKDIEQRLQTLKTRIEQISQKGADIPAKYREKLMSRLKDLIEGPPENDERIIKEVALYAERADIEEEITRFHSHLEQFHEVIASEAPSVGKTLEFLVQELLREANTIGSKAQDVGISRLVVEIKSEIERIREQVQNVE